MSLENDSALFSAELGGQVPEIDIHGMTKMIARGEVESFLNHSFMAGNRVVRIIHGRGEGLLRGEVINLLSNNKLVELYRPSMSPSELGAVTYAKLMPLK